MHDLKPHFFKQDGGSMMGKHYRQESRSIVCLQPENPRDPYNLLKLHRNHLPAGHTGRMYCAPHTKKKLDERPKDVLGRPTWYGGPLGHNKLAKIVGIHCARAGMPTPAGGLGTFIAHSLRRTCLTNGANSGVVNGDTSLMAAGGHTTKEGLKSYLGIDSHERENITAGAFYGRGAANMLAAARAPPASARSAVDSPAEEPAAKRPASVLASCASPLTGPPQPRAPIAGPLQQVAEGPPPVAPLGGGGLFGQLSDLVRCKEAGYLTEPEFAAAKAKILGI